MQSVEYYEGKIEEWKSIEGNISSAIDMCVGCGTAHGYVNEELNGLCVNFGSIDFG